MTSGIFIVRAGVRTGRLAASLSRSGSSVRLTLLRLWIILCLCVLTVRLFRMVRRITSRELSVTAAFRTLSNGPIRDAIWRATCGLTPRGRNAGNAVPDRCVVAAVAASTE